MKDFNLKSMKDKARLALICLVGALAIGGVVYASNLTSRTGFNDCNNCTINNEAEPQDLVLSSVAQSNEYNVTSTGSWYPTPAIVSFTTDPATLGSVVVTGANTGIIDFYNTTTTNRLLRTNQAATSTLLIASIPASLAAGTYTFDVKAPNGLLMVSSGTLATSTITWR